MAAKDPRDITLPYCHVVNVDKNIVTYVGVKITCKAALRKISSITIAEKLVVMAPKTKPVKFYCVRACHYRGTTETYFLGNSYDWIMFATIEELIEFVNTFCTGLAGHSFRVQFDSHLSMEDYQEIETKATNLYLLDACLKHTAILKTLKLSPLTHEESPSRKVPDNLFESMSLRRFAKERTMRATSSVAFEILDGALITLYSTNITVSDHNATVSSANTFEVICFDVGGDLDGFFQSDEKLAEFVELTQGNDISLCSNLSKAQLLQIEKAFNRQDVSENVEEILHLQLQASRSSQVQAGSKIESKSPASVAA